MINWFGHCYPYSNFHELNLDWVIYTVKKGEADIKNFIGLNTIKYADPILWDITRQYEANTVVVDPTTGNAFISTHAVPYGTHINNEDYWTQIYNYADVVDTIREQIAYNEGLSTTATRAYVVNDLVFTNDLLYRVIAPMIAGDSFVENSNVVKTTVGTEILNIINDIIDINSYIGDITDLDTTDKSNIVSAINEVVGNIGALSVLETSDKTSIVNALNEVYTLVNTLIGDLTNLTTTDKTNVVSAINEVVGDITTINDTITTILSNIGDLTNLLTTDKSNIVNALNEVYAETVNIQPNKMDYIYMQDYIDIGQTPTQALKNAISDCSPKGTVIIPRCKKLDITERIDIVKPICIRGLDGGMNELEGGNNFTPNSEYTKYSLRFTGGNIGFNILSPSVEIKDLVIHFNVNDDYKCIVFNNADGDTLNMPRNIKLTNLVILNEDGTYTHTTYGVYSDKVTLLSTFTNILMGWVTYGFNFSNASINTSLRFDKCMVTAQHKGFFLRKAQYSYFIGCAVECPLDEGAFVFDTCDCVTLVGCFTEQCLSASVKADSTVGLTVVGMFTTTNPVYQGYLGDVALIGCHTVGVYDAEHPCVIGNGTNIEMQGSRLYMVESSGVIVQNALSNKVVNRFGADLIAQGFTKSGVGATDVILTQIDKRVRIAGVFEVTNTSVTLTTPTALRPLIGEKLVGNGYQGTTNTNGTISLTFDSTGNKRVEIVYEAQGSF